MTRAPITTATSRFTFYDIESLANVFSVCALTPGKKGELANLEIFYLVDDDSIDTAFSAQTMYDVITTENPGLPPSIVDVWNLRTDVSRLRLAEMLGLSDAKQVNNPDLPSSYPIELRPVCDTDDEYDPWIHPFLVGYNSMNYDTSMLAHYLSEVFANFPHHAVQTSHTRRISESSRNEQDREDARVMLAELAARFPELRHVSAKKMREYNDRLFSDEFSDYMPSALGRDTPAALIRWAMLHSGRHIDAARLNESQVMVSQKRLAGMLGHQIKESEKLSHNTTVSTIDELYELLAYNVSDCQALSQLFGHYTYSSAFDLKAGLLAEYPETVYQRERGTQRPKISRQTVRRDRLAIDASSAKFVGRILSPYGKLSDIDAVSFWYPHEQVAREQNTRRFHVLEHCKTFFENNVVPDRDTDPRQAEAYEQFMKVVTFYRSIEGKNFNETLGGAEPALVLREIQKLPNNLPYFARGAVPTSCFATFSTGGIHGAEADMLAHARDSLEHVIQDNMLIRAQLAFPDPTDLVAAAKDQHNALTLPDGSTVDKRLVLIGSDPEKVRYRKPAKDKPEQVAQLERAMAQMSNPADLLRTQRPADQQLHVTLDDGYVIDGKVVLAKFTATGATYRTEPAKKRPELFPQSADGSTKLAKKYAFTSAGLVIHEDFTSYYPNLLRNMRAFWNPDLGEDRYAKIFFDKERYGAEIKQLKKQIEQIEAQPAPDQERIAELKVDIDRLNTLRNGTKLVLNAASGAGDASHETPIRMNNQIISMRIIGQLFSWLIGQAQTLEGAKIISTNTDGLYSLLDPASGFDEAVNNRVLAEQEASIGVEIEPEPLFLISKDSNNRLELTAPEPGASVVDAKIISAGGGTLACYAGPSPTKSLAHPAVIDFALARYLQVLASRGQDAFSEPFDEDLGRKLMQEAVDPDDLVSTALMFQNVIAASRGSISYPFAVDPVSTAQAEDAQGSPEDGPSTSATAFNIDEIKNPRSLQMVNRVFVVKTGTPGAVSLLQATARAVPAATRQKRLEQGLSSVDRKPVALEILRQQGWANTVRERAQDPGMNMLPADQDVRVQRINSIDPSWSMLIRNDDLRAIDKQILAELIGALDLDIYTQMLRETYTKNWMNSPRG